MAHGFSNRVWVATSTTGTGDVSIGAAKPAHLTPEQAGTPDGAERTWLLEEGNDFEIYRGAYDDINKTVERGTVILSLIAGVAGTTRMNLAGTATLRIAVAAEDMPSPHGPDFPWYATPIGGIVLVDTSIAGVAVPPQSHPDLVFIELTAGLDGAGEFNENKLTGESISGSAPLVVATAVVDVAGSPLYGQTIHLINTEEAILRPRASGIGSLQQDQMQQIVGGTTNIWTGSTSGTGAFTATADSTIRGAAGTGYTKNLTFDSANSPGARAGSETRMKNLGATAYRRVQ